VGHTIPAANPAELSGWQQAVVRSITSPIIEGAQGLARLKSTAESIADQALGPLAKTYDPMKAKAEGEALLAHPASSVLNTFVPVNSTIEDLQHKNYGGALANVGLTALGAAGLHEALTRPTLPVGEPVEGPPSARPAEMPAPATETPAAVPPVGTSIAADVPAEPSVRSAPVMPDVGTTLPKVGTSIPALEAQADARGTPVPEAKAIAPADLVREDTFLTRFPEEQRPQMQQILEENGGFETQRRGVQPMARTEALAKELQTPPTTTPLAPGTILNDVEATSLANAVSTAFDKVTALAKKVNADDATDADRVALRKAQLEATVLLQSARGVTAETGRALNAHKILAQVVEANPDAKLLQMALKKPELRELDNFAEQWANLPDDEARVQFMRQAQPMSKFDMALSVFYSGLLSAPKTLVRAFTGTGANAVFRKASLFPAAAIDAVQSAITGDPRTIRPLTELGAQLGAIPQAAKAAAATAADTLRTGHGPIDEMSFIPRRELPGGAANPLNWPGRAFEAKFQGMSQFYGLPELAGRLSSEAARQADAAGLAPGPDRDAFLANKADEFALDPPANIVKAATDEAKSILFREPSGAFLKRLEDVSNRGGTMGKALKFVVPFAQIAGKITKQGIENSPLAFMSGQFQEAMHAGGRVRAEALGRTATGTGLIGTAGALAVAGYLTGPGPSDPRELAAMRQTGWQPYSIKIGHTYYGYDQFAQPIALGLRTISDAADQFTRTGAVDVKQTLLGIGRSIFDTSFLSGLSSAVNAVTDPGRYGERFVQGFAQDAVPFSSGMRSLTTTLDPTVRAPETVGQAMASIVPGLSTTVPPKLDMFGQPIVRTAGTLARALSPALTSAATTDPIVLALATHGITDISVPEKTLNKTTYQPAITLSEAERARLGHATRQAVEMVVTNPGWASLDHQAAEEYIHRAIDLAHRNVILQIRSEHALGR
jgi:hypothetical protein